MKAIDPAEISALIDGELSPERAAQVRRAIAEDQSLKRVYEQTTSLDVDLKSYAADVAFHPSVSVEPETATANSIGVVPMALGVLVVRVAAKLLPTALGVGLEIVVLGAVLVWVLQRLICASDTERRELAAKIMAGRL